MKNLLVALSSLTLSIFCVSLQADSLRDIYELALENDAQIKAEEAVYLARRETENLARSALLPQVGASYSYQHSDGDTDALGPVFGDQGIIIDDTFTNRNTDTDGYTISSVSPCSICRRGSAFNPARKSPRKQRRPLPPTSKT